MASGPSKKGLWNNDRISDLPDEILCKILSYLPLKDVVTTSILSTRWKPLSPASVSLIQLDFRGSRESEFFHRCMHKLMNVTFRDLRFVETIDFNIDDLFFYAVFEHADWEGTIASWVAAFTRLNVQNLRLVSCHFGSKGLCGSLHGCSTLVELELSDFRDFDLSDEFLLPNLKRLLLYEFETDWDTNTEKLLRGCPVLNDFRIVKCNFGISDIFRIQHPNIKRLFVQGFASLMAEVECPNLEVDCPNLEVMVFKERHVANFVLKSVKSLHSVCIELGDPREWDEGANLTELVKACSSTTRLWLTGNLVMCLFRWSVPLPTFPNLTCLALGRFGRYGWRMLVRLLESAPNLTELTFEEGLDFTLPYTESKSMLPSFKRVSTDSKSMLPRSLRAYTDIKSSQPGSLLLKIKKIEILEFKWTPDEEKLIEYFLKKGKVLQELIVHCLPCENKSGLKKLSMLPRYSDTCQVFFKDKSNLEKSRDSRENWF